MKAIIEMNRVELLELKSGDVKRFLPPAEILHMALTLGASWSYDYEALKAGKPGMHALLKSGLHSEGFFDSKILLQPVNILNIMARQIVMRLLEVNVPRPDYVAGIPNGATRLGLTIANMLGAWPAEMEKRDGRIRMLTSFEPMSSLLFIEDFCSRCTGFTEAVLEVRRNYSTVNILPYNPVIINRGGLDEIEIDGVGKFSIPSVAKHRVRDWPASECPLCMAGSIPIKPKATDENWQRLIHSQD